MIWMQGIERPTPSLDVNSLSFLIVIPYTGCPKMPLSMNDVPTEKDNYLSCALNIIIEGYFGKPAQGYRYNLSS